MAELSDIERSFDEIKNKSRVSTPNPWLDAKFNRIDPWGKEPGIRVDDIPERLGLIQQGQTLDLFGNNFIDLGDTPSNYGKNEQFVKTDGDGKLTFDWPYWVKAGSTIYYKKGKVGVGLSAPLVRFHTFGDNILDGAVTINESGRDKDFRVEGTGNVNLIFADASADYVGIRTNQPQRELHIVDTKLTDAFYHPYSVLVVENDGNTAISVVSAIDASGYIEFSGTDAVGVGRIDYDHANDQMDFYVNSVINLRLEVASTLGAIFYNKYVEIDSSTLARFIADAHNADAYFELQEDDALKWTMGFDYSDGSPFQISEGAPGSNVVLTIPSGAGSISFVRDADKGLMYLDTGDTTRWMLRVASSTNIVEILNRASHGKIEIHANTSTAGSGGDVLVATFEDDIITLAVDLRLSSNKELRFYDNGNYVGFEAPALSSDQIWVLPAADASQAGSPLVSDSSGNLSWAGAVDLGAGNFVTTGTVRWSEFVHDTTTDYNLFLGKNAGASIEDGGQYNLCIGEEAGLAITTGVKNVIIGYQTGKLLEGGHSNIAIGYEAFIANVSGFSNVAIGRGALKNSTGSISVAIGHNALVNLLGGGYNTAIGSEAGFSLTSGQRNFFLGRSTGKNNKTGNDNIYIGHQAGEGVADQSHSNNVFIGKESGFSITTGGGTVAIGYGAGRSIAAGNRCVFIGYEAGYNNITSDKLYIANSNTATPLIYGEFPNTLLRVNAPLDIGRDGALRGALTLWDGAGGNTPGYAKIHSPDGTAWYVFVEDDGTVKIHNAVPTASADGDAIGDQTD